MAKSVEIGNLIIKEVDKNGTKQKSRFIGLGKKSKDVKYAKYDTIVEINVYERDPSKPNEKGKLITSQTDNFLQVVDLRTEADELLSLGLISEEQAEKMRETRSKLPEMIKYSIRLSTKG